MPTCRVVLELRSGLGTPLAADTLWGHLAWGIRYASGEQALVKWLEQYATESPPLVLSDPFPSGYWPRPALPAPRRRESAPTTEQADLGKCLDKRSWVPATTWLKVHSDLAPERIVEALSDAPTPPVPTSEAVPHAAINRLTGGTAQAEGGTLYSTIQEYYEAPVRFDVWCLSPEPPEVVRSWFEQGIAGGYGRDAATGLGHIVVVSVDPQPLPTPATPNAGMLLSLAVPQPQTPARGFFVGGVRSGRVGGEFAINQLPDGSVQRQKRPVRCLMTRTILFTEEPPPPFVGRLVSGVHEFEALRHYGIGLVLPLRLSDAVVQDPLIQPMPCFAEGVVQ